jgi:hypothetical protein
MQLRGYLFVDAFKIFGLLRFEHCRAGLVRELQQLIAGGRLGVVPATSVSSNSLVFRI